MALEPKRDRLIVGDDDRTAGAEVDLRLGPRCALHSPERHFRSVSEPADEAFDAVVPASEAMLAQ